MHDDRQPGERSGRRWQATANTVGPDGVGRNTFVLVQIFDASGNNVPENVNVMVICP